MQKRADFQRVVYGKDRMRNFRNVGKPKRANPRATTDFETRGNNIG